MLRDMVLLVFLWLGMAAADRWAVIAVGSSGFGNYRHQADGCHAYQTLRKSGIPEENIITMMVDDVAGDESNPFPGKLFNQPGDSPPDVYAGCKIDYRSTAVTAQLFMDVLTGNATAAKGKVLKSGPEDTVFVNFVDHGGPGIIEFPNGPMLHVMSLSNTLETMQSKKMFKELVFYMEACESGSMFPNLTEHGKILAVTAANARESSWGTFCGSDAVVNGKSMSTCLGDLFSVNWLSDSDKGAWSSETFGSQIETVKNLTNKSHVQVFGDLSLLRECIGQVEALGEGPVPVHPALPSDTSKGMVDVRDIYVTQAMWNWQHAPAGSEQKARAWKHLMAAIADMEFDEALFENMVAKACADVNLLDCRKKFLTDQMPMTDLECHYKLAHRVHTDCPASPFHQSPGGWNGFNMKFSQVLVNFCEGQSQLGKSVSQLDKLIQDQCEAASASRFQASQILI